MSLPPQFLEELRSRTSLPSLIGRRVRLARSGRDTKGCCPFHNEKTPSFYVYDDHFHCFGCGAHGDAIGFVMRAQNAGFMEAVEILAAEAGLSVPSPSPQAEAAERKRAGLGEVLTAAAAEFQRRLHQKEGAEALAYLRRRGLSDTTIERFGLGWAGEGRGSLAASLARQSIIPEQLIQAGLMKEGRPPVDYFFNRVMFPIRDRRGRVISFGGRILGDGQPKYLNGPETELFSKRRTLYGLDTAREAARNGAPLIVAEGYMDVIALAEAGFPGAVAPLGTALTEDHLAELWKLSPAPVLCFDGDAAGRRATLRSAELALKALTPERTLSVMRLPEGDDPDSLIRKQGNSGFAQALKAARPLAEILFDMLAEGTDQASPEGRAAFRQRLLAAAALIEDRSLAGEYRSALLDRFFASRRRGPEKKRVLTLPRPIIDQAATNERRAHVLIAILLRHPELLASVDEAFGMLDLPPACARLREGMDSFLAVSAAGHITGMQPLDSAHLLDHLSNLGLKAEVERVLSMSPVPASAL
ncbi:MAG TPA: DNA primase, partial [Acetobacteraceae bacterium]|nr:DNA primase [Acetobacteraceae bacterium]